ncbi:hypothetical protein MNBD_BACTEROID03-2005 [hydrothermal vent metagenome]|uniref:Chromosome partitioning protein ParA n=1 Tax=hydrothermal vent metagenome TaxID=652676 RepID=A0A3B0TU49_9ZZZZ
MDGQDTKFNYKIILAALGAVIIGIVIAFYYSYTQSQTQINFLGHEKDLLVKDLTLMKADVDRLSALDEVNDIELQSSRYRIQQLLDSVGKLNFTVEKLREYKTELRRLETKNDSLKLKNDFLKYTNTLITDKYEESQNQINKMRENRKALAKAEALQRSKIKELNKELKIKKYLKLQTVEGSAFRLRGGKPTQTNKASTVAKLRGCVTILPDASLANQERVIYFQFLSPSMGVIEDNANSISVNGNIYSKRVQFLFNGEQTEVCDFITLPERSLSSGGYILNVFEDQRLLESFEFMLK